MKQIFAIFILCCIFSCNHEEKFIIKGKEAGIVIEASAIYNDGFKNLKPFPENESREILEKFDNISGFTNPGNNISKKNYLKNFLAGNKLYHYQLKMGSVVVPCILVTNKEGTRNERFCLNFMRIYSSKPTNLKVPLLLIDYSATHDDFGSGHRNSLLEFYPDNCLILRFSHERIINDILLENGKNPGRNNRLTIISKISRNGTIKVIESYRNKGN